MMKLVKSKDVAWTDAMQKGNFGQRRKELGKTGALSCGLWELPPGKKSFPFHMHYVTEEAMYVVSGSGKVRTPEGLTAVGAGDWVGFPPGDGAHQLINDGTEPLVYLAMGVNASGSDVVEYPDSNKVATRSLVGDKTSRYIFKKDAQAEYFDGEKDAG